MNKLSDLTLEDMTKTEDGMELSRKTVNFARIGKRDASGRSHLVSAEYSGMSIRLDYNAVKTALANNNLPQLRDMSDQFYRISGEYRRLVNYASQMLTFDYLIIPRVDPTTIK